MSDLNRLYAELAEAARANTLPTAAELRRRADRRARLTMVLGTAVAALVVLVASVATARVVLSGPDPMPPPLGASLNPTPSATATSPDPTGTPTADPGTPTGDPVPPTGVRPGRTPARNAPAGPPRSVPDRAFLVQPPNTQHGEPRMEVRDVAVLPRLCGARYGSDGALAARRTMRHLYWLPNSPDDAVPHGTVFQTISTYRDRGAADFVDQLARAVRACPRETAGGLSRRYSLVEAGQRGDQALLIREEIDVTDVNGDPGGTMVRQTSVVRVGAVVTVLRDEGWEGADTVPSLLGEFTRLAVVAIRDWLR
ncbi:hypothetical protein AB0J86_07505 [Micromonospora sp. NPDC049559]|uniref:hypothetical protein n=1 Tax=Micromonospora sp. NPDC049559 TaxID=3155923 RepID=UPI003440988E